MPNLNRHPCPTGALRLEGNGTDRLLTCRVLQSPLAGVSDGIFRGLVRRWAPEALLLTEMVNATALELGHGGAKMAALDQDPGPVGVQLFDHRPEAMAEAARRAEAAGAFLIDINMGCPVRKIARKGGGSGLIRDPDRAARIVAAVAGAVRIPVTVKTRLGWCDAGPGAGEQGPGESNDSRQDGNANAAQAVAWCEQLERAGAQLLTLHGRTREQGFGGKADWPAIAAVKRALAIPVIANGDVRSPEDALRCLALVARMQVGAHESRRLAQPRRNVLAVVGLRRRRRRLGQRRDGERLAIETVRKTARRDVARVVGVVLRTQCKHRAADPGIDEWAVACHAHDDVGARRAGGAEIAIQHVALRATECHDAAPRGDGPDRSAFGGVGNGADHDVGAGDGAAACQYVLKHATVVEELEHLARQPA
jgi:tRNA-dihydrouridine synthase